jgi:hypothetical protein
LWNFMNVGIKTNTQVRFFGFDLIEKKLNIHP